MNLISFALLFVLYLSGCYDDLGNYDYHEINEIEEKFVSAIGNRCEIKGNLSKGKLMIRYRSQQDLERIYSLLSDGGELFTE